MDLRRANLPTFNPQRQKQQSVAKQQKYILSPPLNGGSTESRMAKLQECISSYLDSIQVVCRAGSRLAEALSGVMMESKSSSVVEMKSQFTEMVNMSVSMTIQAKNELGKILMELLLPNNNDTSEQAMKAWRAKNVKVLEKCVCCLAALHNSFFKTQLPIPEIKEEPTPPPETTPVTPNSASTGNAKSNDPNNNNNNSSNDPATFDLDSEWTKLRDVGKSVKSWFAMKESFTILRKFVGLSEAEIRNLTKSSSDSFMRKLNQRIDSALKNYDNGLRTIPSDPVVVLGGFHIAPERARMALKFCCSSMEVEQEIQRLPVAQFLHCELPLMPVIVNKKEIQADSSNASANISEKKNAVSQLIQAANQKLTLSETDELSSEILGEICPARWRSHAKATLQLLYGNTGLVVLDTVSTELCARQSATILMRGRFVVVVVPSTWCIKEDPGAMSLLKRELDPEKQLATIHVKHVAVYSTVRNGKSNGFEPGIFVETSLQHQSQNKRNRSRSQVTSQLDIMTSLSSLSTCWMNGVKPGATNTKDLSDSKSLNGDTDSENGTSVKKIVVEIKTEECLSDGEKTSDSECAVQDVIDLLSGGGCVRRHSSRKKERVQVQVKDESPLLQRKTPSFKNERKPEIKQTGKGPEQEKKLEVDKNNSKDLADASQDSGPNKETSVSLDKNGESMNHQNNGINQQNNGMNQQNNGMNQQNNAMNQQNNEINQQNTGMNQQNLGMNRQNINQESLDKNSGKGNQKMSDKQSFSNQQTQNIKQQPGINPQSHNRQSLQKSQQQKQSVNVKQPKPGVSQHTLQNHPKQTTILQNPANIRHNNGSLPHSKSLNDFHQGHLSNFPNQNLATSNQMKVLQHNGGMIPPNLQHSISLQSGDHNSAVSEGLRQQAEQQAIQNEYMMSQQMQNMKQHPPQMHKRSLSDAQRMQQNGDSPPLISNPTFTPPPVNMTPPNSQTNAMYQHQKSKSQISFNPNMQPPVPGGIVRFRGQNYFPQNNMGGPQSYQPLPSKPQSNFQPIISQSMASSGNGMIRPPLQQFSPNMNFPPNHSQPPPNFNSNNKHNPMQQQQQNFMPPKPSLKPNMPEPGKNPMMPPNNGNGLPPMPQFMGQAPDRFPPGHVQELMQHFNKLTMKPENQMEPNKRMDMMGTTPYQETDLDAWESPNHDKMGTLPRQQLSRSTVVSKQAQLLHNSEEQQKQFAVMQMKAQQQQQQQHQQNHDKFNRDENNKEFNSAQFRSGLGPIGSPVQRRHEDLASQQQNGHNTWPNAGQIANNQPAISGDKEYERYVADITRNALQQRKMSSHALGDAEKSLNWSDENAGTFSMFSTPDLVKQIAGNLQHADDVKETNNEQNLPTENGDVDLQYCTWPPWHIWSNSNSENLFTWSENTLHSSNNEQNDNQQN